MHTSEVRNINNISNLASFLSLLLIFTLILIFLFYLMEDYLALQIFFINQRIFVLVSRHHWKDERSYALKFHSL